MHGPTDGTWISQTPIFPLFPTSLSVKNIRWPSPKLCIEFLNGLVTGDLNIWWRILYPWFTKLMSLCYFGHHLPFYLLPLTLQRILDWIDLMKKQLSLTSFSSPYEYNTNRCIDLIFFSRTSLCILSLYHWEHSS